MLGEPVAGVEAELTAHRQQRVEGGPQVLGSRGGQGRRVGRHRQPVVVRGERQGDRSQAGHREFTGEPGGERRLERRIGEQVVDERGPALLEGDARLDVLEDPEARRQPDVEGMLAQDPGGEAVQGGERGLVELVQGGGAVSTGRRVGVPLVVAGREPGRGRPAPGRGARPRRPR